MRGGSTRRERIGKIIGKGNWNKGRREGAVYDLEKERERSQQ